MSTGKSCSRDFSEGFARVRLAGDTNTAQWVFIDTTGKQVGPTYKYAWNYRNGYARVRANDGREFLIGHDMKVVPKIDGPFAGDMSENGYIAVKRDGGVAYIRRDGSVAIPANKLSQFAVVGYEFTSGRTVAEYPGAVAGPKVPVVWYEIRQSGRLGSAGISFQVLYAIVDAPEKSRAEDIEDDVTNKPRNTLAVTVASGAYPLPPGQTEPDLDDILSRSTAKPRYTKASNGKITFIDSVDPRYLGHFRPK